MTTAIATYKRSPAPTLQTLLSTAATLTNNSLAIGSAITLTDAAYIFADILLNATWATAPTANTGISCWLLREDGSGNYEDGDASTTPARNPDFVIPVRAVNTAQVVIVQAQLPPGAFKLLAKNDATGQTISSGWTIKAICFTYQNG